VRTAFAIAAKDLRAEARSKEVAPAMLLFALALVFLFTFALPPGSGRAPIPLPRAGSVGALEIASVFLWSSLLFAAIVGFGRSAALEREGSRLDALVLAPVDPALVFAGKVIANFLYLSFIAILVFFSLVVFIGVAPSAILGFLPIALMTNIGLAVIGTLFGTATQYSRAKELLLPLLIFPSVLPLLLAAIRLTSEALVHGAPFTETRWFILIAVYDIVFATIGAVTFEFVIRE